MKKKVLGIIALMLVMVVALTGCSYVNQALDFIKELISPSVALTDAALATEKIIDFKDGANSDVLFESDGWSNGDVFNVVWKQHNVHYENGIMRLGITEEKVTAWVNDAEVEYAYTAGEARTQNYYHYGDYEVSMKPSANPGTASTFFICTGPYDLKDGVPNAHDEIDIEFLGQDTTHVQFNFFVDGKGGNEYMYDLGFDASKEFHTYGFRWAKDSITWFVDGVPVYKVTTDTSVKEAGNLKIVEKLPSTAGRILANYWCGNERAWAWMGRYTGETKDNGTQYQWIATNAEGAPLNPPVVTPPVGGEEETEINWADIAPISPEFPDAAPYDVTVEGNKANVVYTDVSGSAYMPIELDVTDAVAGKNYVYLKVTNNGTETVNVRVNMFDPTLTGNNKATNISATMNGVAVRTDLEWGGSFFDIPAGESAELVVNFGVGGIKLQLMIDSSRNDGVLRSGDVTIEDIKFAAVGEVQMPHKCEDANEDGKCDGCGEDMPTPPPPAPADPESGNLKATINGEEFTFEGNVADGYGVNVADGVMTVEYTNIVGNSYKNIWATVSSVAGTRNTFTMKVTNNGTESVKVRIDIESQTQVTANTTCCNVSATQNGVEAYTDLEWGGSTFVIEAGATATLEVVYDASKTPTNLKIFVDSCQWDDNTSHAGNITISEMEFKGETAPVEPEHSCEHKCEECGKCTDECEEEACADKCQGHAPAPADPTPVVGEFLKYAGNDCYTFDGENYLEEITFTYENVSTNTYQNVNAWIKDKAAGKATLDLYIINNGEETAYVTVKLEAAGAVALAEEKVYIAAGEVASVTLNFTGEAEMLYFFIDTGWSETTTSHSGSVTVAGVRFSGEAGSGSDPVTPPAGDGLKLDLWVSDSSLYTANGHNIKYSGAGNTYACAGSNVATHAAGKSTFTVTITNNGAADAKVRIDIQGTNQVGNHKVLNTGATGGNVWTDMDWGGSSVTVAAGESVTLVITYDENTDRGAVVDLVVFVDSARGDSATYNSDITLSGMSFS